MSDAITQRWRDGVSQPALLVQIDFVSPSAKTIRLSDKEVDTHDGNTWEHRVSACSPIREANPFCGPGVDPVTADITLSNEPLASQGASDKLFALASQFYFQGATVTMYLWDLSFATFSTQAKQIFKGVVNRYEATEKSIILYLMQSRSWNVDIPQRVVNPIDYPEAPDTAQGAPIPVVYGKHTALTMRSPWTSPTTNIRDHEDAGAGQGVVPLILVDRGTGVAKVKVVAAQHACAKILDRSNGMSAFIKGGDRLSPLDTGGLTEFLGAGQADSYITIDDGTLVAYAAVIPTDVRTGAGQNTAVNPRRAMDVFNETTFASLDQAAGLGQGTLQLTLPDLSNLGAILAVTASVAFVGNAANTNPLRIRPKEPTIPNFGTAITGASTGTTPSILTGTWDVQWYINTWQFSKGTAGVATTTDICIDFTGGAANKASVIWAVLIVKYQPQRSIVIPGARLAPITPSTKSVLANYRPWLFTPATPIYQLDGQFFGNIEGYADDGSGTFSGVASAVLERPSDIARHLLSTYSGLTPATDFEIGAGNFGSFVDARTRIRNAQNNEFAMAVHVGDLTDIGTVLRELAAESLCAVYLDRFTNKWLFHVWMPGAQPNYGYTFRWEDVAMSAAGISSDVDTQVGVRVQYLKDYQSNRTLFEAFVNKAGSSQGYTTPTLTDQNLVVATGVNDALDWKYTGGSQQSIAIPAGTYTPINLASQIRGQMRATSPQAEVGWGFDVITGYNDALDFTVSGTPYLATLRQGSYSADSFCIEAARAMNAAGSPLTFSFTYDQSANKFNMVASNSVVLLSSPSLAPNQTTSGWHIFGLIGDSGSVTTYTFANVRYAERFWIAEKGAIGNTLDLLWLTGTHAATSCGTLLGFDITADQNSLYDNATFLRGGRQAVAVDAAAKTGPKAESVVGANWIRLEQVAVQLRNRLFDLTAKPVTTVKFVTACAPDMKRHHAFSFSSDLDAHIPFPRAGSDGSWAGKTFIATSITQYAVDKWYQEIEGVEV